MSKFILTAGLVLGSLGSVGAAPAEEHAGSPGQVAFSPDEDTQDFGPFDYLYEAIAARDEARARGFACNVVTKDDGYYIRVFAR